MRVLVACPQCSRQYEATGLQPGDRFHCTCGQTLETPAPRPHDAAVVRCSSCGAPREGESRACRFCSADFTLHERDLHTICPGCMARVSDRARYCHHCATRLLPAAEAGRPSDSSCPVCGDEAHLTSRRLGDPGIGILECPACAGMWLANEELELVLERARAAAGAALVTANAGSSERDRMLQVGPLYRPCPVCGSLMHRRNFGRKSGVIVDQCGSHGFWFDSRELEAVLGWVRQGGEHRAERAAAEETRAAASRQLARQLEPSESNWRPAFGAAGSGIDLLAWVLGRVFRH